MNNKILITGAAGFIGYHLCERMIQEGYQVVGLDNINDYYDVNLKYARLANLGITENSICENEVVESTIHGATMRFVKMNLEDEKQLPELFRKENFDVVCNLAAQHGVRYSIENPKAYINSNILGFHNLLECIRHNNVPKLVYASSSSIYGNSDKVPFSVEDKMDEPISLYAATKKSNELMAHTYSYLYDFQAIGLRFFTVYGPWGRPDMVPFLFTNAIIQNEPIKVFNNGNLLRDFTYVDDIIEGVSRTVTMKSDKKYALYNIGNGHPIKLMDFIAEIEMHLKKEAIKDYQPMQPGDVSQTLADTSKLSEDYQYCPRVNLGDGLKEFVRWYKDFYQ